MGDTLASMTGFGRAAAHAEGCAIVCEIKAVNGRGLDIRTRLSSGFDVLETDIRRIVGSKVSRGSVSVYLNVQREAGAARLVVNTQALESVLEAIDALKHKIDAEMPSIDGILALKGVVDTVDTELSADAEERLHTAIRDCIATAVTGLLDVRRREGEQIAAVIARRIDDIAALTAQAEDHPARSREAILARLKEQVRTLLDSDNGLSEERLHAEALVLATKADIREELDRLKAHVDAARGLLEMGGPVGRKLDFLSQEFNREANTLCSKSNDVGLTRIGLDLKAAIDQLREQVQNLE
ncbi:YicC/YloC family endoribonuclease [Pelagibacterium xiamenense]|uniref:YicC/YloC family endoribonuclease n=1 Tax=Pelagibacterium xiamenense TaxID=2901140 RepID=UPI001E2F7E37|nr:YicC/YloC family endoribonuclease [Pelagibacterium xiamenense]MCD7060825.1 YicC family protein [Pelagibacterium xiamenense]